MTFSALVAEANRDGVRVRPAARGDARADRGTAVCQAGGSACGDILLRVRCLRSGWIQETDLCPRHAGDLADALPLGPAARRVLEDLTSLAEVAMRAANGDGGAFAVDDELADARALLNLDTAESYAARWPGTGGLE